MRNFFDWFEDSPDLSRDDPWLILGKGPSFARIRDLDLGGFRTLSLNHAVRERPVLLAHMIDLDVVEACADVIPRNARFLVVPRTPHIDNRPANRPLEEFIDRIPVLRQMEAEDRLLTYDLELIRFWEDREAESDPRIVRIRFFSVEAALKLLAQAGVRTVRSLGIDGGSAYSPDFEDLKETTLLSNKRKSFNSQFQQIARTIMDTGVDYAPLDVEAPIRVFVGSMEPQMLAVKVLEYSIRKHTSMSVEIFPLHHASIEVPTPQDPGNRPRTPFSFQRFMIPALAGFQGRAVYVDSDMQVFKDMREIWTLPFNGADLLAVREPGSTGRKPQFSVMLLDCEALHWEMQDIVAALDRGDLTYETLMYEMAVAKSIRADIDPNWNSLERYAEGETALLHYTDMRRQPWVSRDNPLGYLWVRDLLEAVERGFIPKEYVEEHVREGYIRPSLLYQLEHRIEDPLLLPKEARAMDRSFVPPYKQLGAHGASPWSSPVRFARAVLRHYYNKTPVPKLVRGVRERFEV